MGKDNAAPQGMAAIAAQLKNQHEDLLNSHADHSLSSEDRRARRIARLILVQALYQMDLTGLGVEAVITEFINHRLDDDTKANIDGVSIGASDPDFFASGLRGVVSHQDEIDALIISRLANNWRIERLDATLRAILRSGAWELRFRSDIGIEVTISEYVEIAKAFFGDSESKFVNAALDGMAVDIANQKA